MDRAKVKIYHAELGTRIAFFMDAYRERTKSKITLKDLAIEAGYSTRSGMMSQVVKHGKSGIEAQRLEKIALKLGVEMETLAHAGHISEEDLCLVDNFFKALKNKNSRKYQVIQLLFGD